MATISAHDAGYVINDTVLVADSSDHEFAGITLLANKGPAMQYGTHKRNILMFPGEYGLGDVVVRCWEAGDALHYVVRFGDGESVAVLHNPKSVEHDSLKTAQVYLCADTETKERLEQNEFEGEIMTFADAVV